MEPSTGNRHHPLGRWVSAGPCENVTGRRAGATVSATLRPAQQQQSPPQQAREIRQAEVEAHAVAQNEAVCLPIFRDQRHASPRRLSWIFRCWLSTNLQLAG